MILTELKIFVLKILESFNDKKFIERIDYIITQL